MEEHDFYKTVDETEDVDFLENLVGYIEDDIKSLENQSPAIIVLKSKMHECTPEIYIDRVKKTLLKRKEYVEKKLFQLKGGYQIVKDTIDSENVDFLVGMSKAEAEKSIQNMGYTTRIIREDSDLCVISTMEFRYDRVNLDIENGVVTKANIF